jgi:hypothetical protein
VGICPGEKERRERYCDIRHVAYHREYEYQIYGRSNEYGQFHQEQKRIRVILLKKVYEEFDQIVVVVFVVVIHFFDASDC